MVKVLGVVWAGFWGVSVLAAEVRLVEPRLLLGYVCVDQQPRWNGTMTIGYQGEFSFDQAHVDVERTPLGLVFWQAGRGLLVGHPQSVLRGESPPCSSLSSVGGNETVVLHPEVEVWVERTPLGRCRPEGVVLPYAGLTLDWRREVRVRVRITSPQFGDGVSLTAVVRSPYRTLQGCREDQVAR